MRFNDRVFAVPQVPKSSDDYTHYRLEAPMSRYVLSALADSCNLFTVAVVGIGVYSMIIDWRVATAHGVTLLYSRGKVSKQSSQDPRNLAAGSRQDQDGPTKHLL